MTTQDVSTKLSKFLDEGRAEEAAAWVAESLGDLAQEPRAILPVLDALDRQKNDKALLQLIERLEREDKLRLETLIFTLRLRFRADDYPSALQAVDMILALAPNNTEALRTGGRIGNLQKNDDVALWHWERLAAVSAADPEAALQAARIRARRQDHRQALDWAWRAAELRPESPEPLQIAAAAGLELGWPEVGDVLLSRLFTMDRTRALRITTQLMIELDNESAARVLSLLVQHHPSDQGVAELVAKTYPEWVLAGLEQELASNDLEAAAFYRAARRLRPDLPDPQNGLERLNRPSLVAMREAFNGRDFEAAIEHGSTATRIDANCLEAWRTVARAHFNRSDVTKALDAFRHCTMLQPEDGRNWLTQGLMLNHAGDRPAALAAFQKAKQFSGPADAELRSEAESSIAALHPQLVRDAQQAADAGDLELAWRCCEAAGAIRPDNSGIDRLKRRLLRALREQIRLLWEAQSASVAALCRQYLEKSPSDRYAATVLGRTLMGTRAYAEALPVWEGLCKSSPDDSHFHLQVARCCRSLKIRDRGLAAAQAALRLDPQLREAAEVAEYLRNLAPLAGAAEPHRRVL